MNTQVLFEEYRAGLLECIHYGTVCVVNAQGLFASVGDTDWTCFYRSASKPLQSLPVLLHGLDKKYGLTEEETAILSGSHWADEEHICVLDSILAKTELKEEQMVMLPAYPNRAVRKEQLIREHMPMRKIYHNCSGKHLGMMLLARELGEPVEVYWGFYAIGIHSLGLGIAAKIIDGSHDEFAAAVLRIFEELGYRNPPIIQKIKESYSDIILNDNREEVGLRKAVFRLSHETQ